WRRRGRRDDSPGATLAEAVPGIGPTGAADDDGSTAPAKANDHGAPSDAPASAEHTAERPGEPAPTRTDIAITTSPPRATAIADEAATDDAVMGDAVMGDAAMGERVAYQPRAAVASETGAPESGVTGHGRAATEPVTEQPAMPSPVRSEAEIQPPPLAAEPAAPAGPPRRGWWQKLVE
ncbi:MAG: hypothetical protein ACREER_00260, partial [Alphaproteobacteria bacterium]